MFPLILALLATTAPADYPAERATKWEPEVAAIEKRLADNPPAKGGIVFVGSSSIRLWDVKKSFPGKPVVNVGFGGSEARDSTHFASRLIFPLAPSTIVFYAGDNDLSAGRTPEQLRDDFTAFTKTIHAKLPTTRVLFITVKPSIARWKLYEVQQKANGLVKTVCASDERLVFVDVTSTMLGSDGKPNPEYFVKDGLHMTPKGYEKWTASVLPLLEMGKK